MRLPGVTSDPAAVRRASNPSLPNRLWIADLAPISSFEAPLYIGTVLDCHSRRCLGWRFSEFLEPELIAGAVEDALITRSPFDRTALGLPVALAFADRCGAVGVSLPSQALPSADRSASFEFFDWLDADVLAAATWRSHEHGKRLIGNWIQSCYNPAVASPPIPLESVLRK